MIAYLGWLIAFAAWGIVSFWALLPLAFIASIFSVSFVSLLLTVICGVTLEPVTERGTLPLGETRDSDEERLRDDTTGSEEPVSALGRVMKDATGEGVAVLAIALFIFAMDWSGFNKWQPDLFFPRPFRDVWWHFPIIGAVVFCALRVLSWKVPTGED